MLMISIQKSDKPLHIRRGCVKVTHPQNFIILRERQLNCFRLLDKLEFTLDYFPTANGIETIFHYVLLTLQFVEDVLKEERSYFCH